MGVPLPGVQVSIAADPEAPSGSPPPGAAAAASTGTSAGAPLATGELRVKGPMLFSEYWGKAEATAESFDEGGYFKTGDIVSLEGEPPYYRVSQCTCRVGVGVHIWAENVRGAAVAVAVLLTTGARPLLKTSSCCLNLLFTARAHQHAVCLPIFPSPPQILGRASVDIIKSSGYKISALDIESVLSRHPDVQVSSCLLVAQSLHGTASHPCSTLAGTLLHVGSVNLHQWLHAAPWPPCCVTATPPRPLLC